MVFHGGAFYPHTSLFWPMLGEASFTHTLFYPVFGGASFTSYLLQGACPYTLYSIQCWEEPLGAHTQDSIPYILATRYHIFVGKSTYQ